MPPWHGGGPGFESPTVQKDSNKIIFVMEKYDFKKIEEKWQKIWEKSDYTNAIYFNKKPKHYHLVEFPYPSGEGLHVGHCMSYGASDAYARMMRMKGFNVLFPIGWDAFGLPTENYAIKNKIKPQDATRKNVENFRRQMKSMGYSFDFSREVNTTDPNYYKWTQWIFLQFYKHGIVDGKLIEIADDDKTTSRLAYQAEMPVNWCPSCKINLANEEVVAGKCERCGTLVEKRMQKQWLLRITRYADRLINDLNDVDYEERIKTQQINWIGKSTGTNIRFNIKNTEDKIEVFTTRADTLFGCTYVVLSPEHPLTNKLKVQSSNIKEVEKYIDEAKNKSDIERTDFGKEKTGVELKGVKAINPINDEQIPVWIADYVLLNYGTGALMAVPAHDQRDFEFAKKYDLPIKEVVQPLFEKTHGSDKARYDIPFKERHPIVAVVKHWSEDKYLCLKWNNTDWRGFVIGGIEDGESKIEAAIREIIEETGYLHPKFVCELGGIINARFFQVNKGENRWAHFQPLYFELIDGEKRDISPDEKKIHEIHWIEKNKVEEFLSWVSDMKLVWYRAITGDYFFGANSSDTVSSKGILVDSGEFTNILSDEAKMKITEKLISMDAGNFSTNFKLRDWIFSRQHYWGEPIPIIHCPKCGAIPVPEEQLPVILPEVENYEPTDNGKSPLDAIENWVNVKCPKCGDLAKRETDTMPNWAGSSWYYLRYCDPTDDRQFASMDKLKYWTPVDLYNGGMEHTTLHLLYSRFWHKFLFDLGVVPTKEPYQKRIAHGLILGPDNQKMSKSRGNVINPDEMIEKFGADSLRAYMMFIGPYDQDSAWLTTGISGVYRWLNRVFENQKLVSKKNDSKTLLVKLNQVVKSVTADFESFSFNTVISKLMELNNLIEKEKSISEDSYKIFLRLLFPVAPHLASEIWTMSKFDGEIEEQIWPKIDEKYLVLEKIPLAVQINGKTRAIIEVETEINQNDIENIAKQHQQIKKYLHDQDIKKTIYVPGKIINFVVK